MKKFLISALLIVSFGGYVTYYYLTSATNAQNTQPAAVTIATTSTTIPTNVSAASTAGSVPPTNPADSSSGTTSTGQYKNGTYTGSVVDAYYGNIQVAATISGGKLTNVTFLQYPNDRGQSVAINKSAMPQLKAEAIQAQSAKVDGVSGASDTSVAFTQSLASALAQASS